MDYMEELRTKTTSSEENDKSKSNKEAGQRTPSGIANSDPVASHDGASP